MEQVVASPPPLPPKIRQSPPASTTVLENTGSNVFSYRFPEVHDHTNTSSSSVNSGSHVVKICIKPQDPNFGNAKTNASDLCDVAPCIRISVNSNSEMIQTTVSETFNKPSVDRGNPYFFCGTFNCGNDMTSGQVSPSDTLDSGTCSDLDCAPLSLLKKNGVSVTVIGEHHKRASSLASSGAEVDSDDNESSVSCDSLNSNELPSTTTPLTPSPLELEPSTHARNNNNDTFLPQGLLQDIRDQSIQLSQALIGNPDLNSTRQRRSSPSPSKTVIDESTYEERKKQAKEHTSSCLVAKTYDTDRFYNFHIKEHEAVSLPNLVQDIKLNDEDTFAGYKDLLGKEGASTIRSAKGTVRGVKNRVRAGIATFLQINSMTKSYKEKDAGKVVVYTTTMGIVRETYNNCMKVKQILRTLLVKFEERDVFMSCEFQGEIIERMRCDHILVPQVFVDGQHVGDAETIERLNETGELRRILKPYKSMDACTTCKVCGGYRLLPCTVCNGSKKSVHRNHFTAEFVALKCMNCDEVGLVRCSSC